MNVPDFSQTTLEAAMANTEASVRLQVDQLNAQLIAGYKTAWGNWLGNAAAGRDAGPAPAVPYGYMVGHFADATDSRAQWAYPTRGNVPVTAALTAPPLPKPYVPPVLPEPESIRNVPVGDTTPVGFVVTAPDGVKWQKQSSHTPFGIAYFYSKVA